MFVPSILLKQLYTRASLTKTDKGLSFSLKNRLKDATIKEVKWISLDGEKIPEDKISLNTCSTSSHNVQIRSFQPFHDRQKA